MSVFRARGIPIDRDVFGLPKELVPLTTHTIGHVTVINLNRVLTGESGLALLAQFDAAGDGNANWLLDMSAVTYIDSAGLGALIQVYNRIQKRGGALRLANLQPRAAHLLTITGLRSVFATFDSDEAALASFPASQPLPEAAL